MVGAASRMVELSIRSIECVNEIRSWS